MIFTFSSTFRNFLSFGERFGDDEELKGVYHALVPFTGDRGIQKLSLRYEKCLNFFLFCSNRVWPGRSF
ncbi:hypothetical protein FQR65_LT09716 [Abscondita terminalis]|nr:hypothetical protein FQR65_LT09716 [Abscondita terminalis]